MAEEVETLKNQVAELSAEVQLLKKTIEENQEAHQREIGRANDEIESLKTDILLYERIEKRVDSAKRLGLSTQYQDGFRHSKRQCFDLGSNATIEKPSDANGNDTPSDVEMNDDERLQSAVNNFNGAMAGGPNTTTIETTPNGLAESPSDDGWQRVTYKNSTKGETPIIVEVGKDSVGALITTIERSVSKNEYTIKRFNVNKPAQIFAVGEEAKEKIMKALSSHGYEFHTNSKSQPKWKCFIMRGMLEETNTETIKQTLMQAGLPEDIEISRFVTGHMRSNPNKTANILYKIAMPASVDTKILKKVNGIAHSRVRFEPMKKSGMVQCKNCQRFSHGTRMCHYKHRCVKCNTQHDVGKCPRNENPNIPLACVNCGGSHSANNLNECRMAKKIMSKRDADNNAGPSDAVGNNNNRAKYLMNSNNRQYRGGNIGYNNSSNNINSNSNVYSGGGGRSWAGVVRGSADGDIGANPNMDLLREMIQTIVTQCIAQIRSQ